MALGVCSWSLGSSDAGTLVRDVLACGLDAVQLALNPLRTGQWPLQPTIDTLHAGGVRVLSGMLATIGEDYSTLDSIRRTGGLRPDEHWEANLTAAKATAELASRMGLRLVTMHAGFLPHDDDPGLRVVMLDRLARVADEFAERGLTLGLETGQERADTLADTLADLNRANVGVNFDPANMLLYGMGDPVAAVNILGEWIVQVHVKDARRSPTPGVWGSEQPVGTGEVDWPAFFAALERSAPRVDLVIEREAGGARIADIRQAAELVERTAPSLARRA